ncbi:hypothetical protein CK796_07160 [Lactobacillus gasseri]|nr:hypothetical protein CYJ88_07175 [Lactobacillus gasseri]PMB87425.1 hypothetical protein CK796_07160 [Lactobacillus gasseri]
MYDQDQIVENYSRLHNDFKFQKPMSILILTAAVLNNNQNSTIIEHAINSIRKDFAYYNLPIIIIFIIITS